MSSFNRRSTTPLSSLPSAGPASSSTSTSSPNHLNPSTNISQGQGEPQTAGVRLRRTSLLDALGVERGDERGLNEILQARRTAREVPGSDLSSGNGNGGERMRTPTLVQDSSTTSTGGLRPQAAPFRMREGRPQYVAAAPDHGGRIETGGGSASGSGSGTPAGAGALAPTPSGSGSGSARIGRRRTIVEIDSDTESDSSASLAVPPQPPRVRRQPQNPVFADLLAQMENISSDEDEEDDSYNPEPPVGGAGDLWGSDSGGDMSSSSSSSEEDFEVVGVNINRHRPAPVVQPSGEAGAAMELRSRAPMPVGDGRPNGYRRLPSPGHFARAIEAIDRTMAERQAEANAIFAAEADERRRQILSPPPIAPSREGREPIRLGGGLMVRGDRHINYRPQAGGGGIARTPNTPDRSTAAEPLPRAATQQRWDQIAWNRAQAMRDLIGDNILVGLGYPGIGGIMMGGGAGGAGPAGVRREDDIQTILSKVEPPKYEDAEPGFTQSFDLEDIDAKFNAQSREPIEIDEDGNVIPQKKKQRKSYLVCANCSEPLLVSSAYRGPEDRVWMLRCGHLIDQRCLDKLSTPTTEKELARVDKHPDILGAWEAAEEEAKSKGRAKKTRAAKRARKEPPKVERRPDEYAWRCEVEGCGMEHKSEEVGGVWKGVEGEGAVAVYA